MDPDEVFTTYCENSKSCDFVDSVDDCVEYELGEYEYFKAHSEGCGVAHLELIECFNDTDNGTCEDDYVCEKFDADGEEYCEYDYEEDGPCAAEYDEYDAQCGSDP